MKKINVTSSSLPKFKNYTKVIKNLWRTKLLTNNGVIHQQLESNLKNKLLVKNLSIFTNGHIALEYALEILPSDGEIITTPFTFISTINSIVRKGLKPVFCDINEIDGNIDVTLIEKLITNKTVAILPVHVYGNPCDVYEIEKIAEKHNLKVIYDAAHAFGVEIDNNGIGVFGDVSMFSFHATKVFNTIEGGSLTYKEDKLKLRFDTIKNYGLISQEDAEYIGGNAKMDEFRAAMGICNLEILENEISKRKKLYEKYEELLGNIKGIKFIKTNLNNVKNNYSYLPINFDGFKKTRDEIFDELKKENIFARKYFYPLISDLTVFKKDFDSNLTPNAKHIAKNILTLPLYASLKISDVYRICKIILK